MATLWGAAMTARTSSIVLLVGSAYIGGAATLLACWEHGPILAIAAAPFGGSLAVVTTALLLSLGRPKAGSRASAARFAPKLTGRSG